MGPLAFPSQLQVFIPEHRWGPMSHLPLAQESMREMLTQLTQAVGATSLRPAGVCFFVLLLLLSTCLPHAELLHFQRRLHVHDFACGATPAPLHRPVSAFVCAWHHPLRLSVLQTDALAADPSNSRLAARVSTLWRSFSFVNSFYIKLKVRRTV